MNQMNINKTNGLKFEARFLEELQSRFKTVKTSHSTDYMYICDIVHEDCLIELKSNRDAYKETTQQTFQKICKVGLKSFKATGIKKGLFFQTIELLKYDRSMTIVGNYQIEPNKLHNLFIKNPDQAWFNYHEYKIHTHWSHGSTYTRIPAAEFWKLADESSSLVKLKYKVEEYACDHGGYNNDLDISNHYSGDEHDSAFYYLEISKGFQDPIIENLLSKGESDQWGLNLSIEPQQFEISLDQPTQNWIEKEKQAELDLIEVSKKISIDDLRVLPKEELLIIQEAIENHEVLSDISKKLNKSKAYLSMILKNDPNQSSYKNEKWDEFRLWLKAILLDAFHPQTPVENCDENELRKIIESQRKSINNLRGSVNQHKRTKENLEFKLVKVSTTLNENKKTYEQTERDYKKQINDLNVKVASQEKSQDDDSTILKLEAYQAEIKKLQTQFEGLKKYNIENCKTIDADQIKIESLEKLCSKQVREISKLKRDLQDALSQSKNEAIINVSMDEVERYKRIIDMMLDKQC